MTEREIFSRALEILDAGERARFLDRACAGDAALRARVEELLRLQAEKTTDLFAPSPEAEPPPRSAADPLLGLSIGGVKLVRFISEGGMGRVYEGRQENPRRTVAVKIVKPGVATEKMLRRFEFEAQVLARLEHPGIARVYSAGTFGPGAAAQPFFVMEYIANAKPLTEYARDLKLSTHDRLALFRKVCDAVAHGHQKGVIHRDLKPSNILVDPAGQPKVIDFGVAKTTDSDMALTTMQTDVGRLIGTYQYMSPEQFDAVRIGVDIRSDVYALGVVLYELLAGQPPYDLKRRVLPEIVSIVKQQDPTPLTNVNKTLRRDVGIIAGKCLEKDRNRRYSSASELAADVGRYLAGDPIAAVAPSFWDGVVRLARRHKAAAAAVAGVAASLVAAVVGISVSLLIAEQEGARARRRLYVANLYKLAAALEAPRRGLAKKFFTEAEVSFREAYGRRAPRPLELTVVEPQLDRSLAVLAGHGGDLRSIAISPDGVRVATASSDKTARLWDARTGEPLAVLEGHRGELQAIAFGPDGTCVATTSWDKTARLWDGRSGKSLGTLEGHQATVVDVAFSPDGTRVATASMDGTARLWDMRTGTSLAVLEHDGNVGNRSGDGDSWGSERVDAVAFSPDGTRVATAGFDKTARLWNAETGEPVAVLRGHEEALNSIAFSPDGARVATASFDKTARLWNAETGEPVAVLGGHEESVVCIAFSPDGARVATASFDETARLWNAHTGESLAVLKGHQNKVRFVAFSPDSVSLATASFDGNARLWDARTGESLAVFEGHDEGVVHVIFTPDGGRMATASADATARLWSTRTDAAPAVLGGHHGRVLSVDFSPDGTRVVTASRDATARLWDSQTGESLAVLEGHWDRVFSAKFSPDGASLATTDVVARFWDSQTGEPQIVLANGSVPYSRRIHFSPDGTRVATLGDTSFASLWDPRTGKLLANLHGHRGELRSIAFSPDGSRLATASEDRTARLWDTATGRLLAVLDGHGGAVLAVTFNPDGTRVATASWDRTARLWDAATGRSLAVLEGHGGGLYTVRFSPEGARVATASADKTGRLWSARNGETLAVLEGHEGVVSRVTFSPDGTRVATASADKTARLWDAWTGDSLAVLRGHEDEVVSVVISPAGSRLATVSKHGTARLWGLSNAEIHKNRLSAQATRSRVAPTVDAWFAGDLASVKAKLAEAKATMPPADWREAANLVLIKAQQLRDAAKAAAADDK